jgi:hypothetical protein
MGMKFRTWVASMLCACGLLPAAPGPSRAGQWVDPPDRVVRMNLLEGSAAVQPAGSDGWDDTVVNRPLTTGDRIWVDSNSRAELHLGSIAIRMADRTALQFLQVDDLTVQLKVTAGTVSVRLRVLPPDETFEIDTPSVAVSLAQPGEYRIDVSAGDLTAVSVLGGGQAEIASQTQSFTLRSQQHGEFAGIDSVTPSFDDRSAPDAFDQWAAARDEREDRALSSQFVSPEVTGYEDLDDYGDWRRVADYGAVWVPRVEPGWAPYRTGSWVWISPWGWSWIDDAPWGFAPFHYGRWIHRDAQWCWSPGPIAVRPGYAPALVAWLDGTAEVAWFALGFNEAYGPAYHASAGYLRKVNGSIGASGNATPSDRSFVNQAVAGAVTAVRREAFVSALPVLRNLTGLDPREAAAAHAGTAPPALAPTPRSFLREPRSGASRARPPAALFGRSVVSQIPPPPATPSLEAQRRAIIAHGARPLPVQHVARTAVRNLRPAARRFSPLPPLPVRSQSVERQRQTAQPVSVQQRIEQRSQLEKPATDHPPDRSIERTAPTPGSRSREIGGRQAPSLSPSSPSSPRGAGPARPVP